jgi:biopolymer transport protein ExbD
MPLKTQSDELPNLNLTSLIDVVFLLIVFFMAASKFADSSRDVELKLPEVADGQSLAAPSKTAKSPCTPTAASPSTTPRSRSPS